VLIATAKSNGTKIVKEFDFYQPQIKIARPNRDNTKQHVSTTQRKPGDHDASAFCA
jgi:hypothetical protein